MVKNNLSSSLKQTEDKQIKEVNQIIKAIDKMIYDINLRFQLEEVIN
jgi:hypothetical protein